MEEHKWGPFSEAQSDPAVTLHLTMLQVENVFESGMVSPWLTSAGVCGLPGQLTVSLLLPERAPWAQGPWLLCTGRWCLWPPAPISGSGPLQQLLLAPISGHYILLPGVAALLPPHHPPTRPRSPLSSSCCSPHQEVRREGGPTVHVMPLLPLHTLLLEKSLCWHRVDKDRAQEESSAWSCPLPGSPEVPRFAAADLQS